MLKIYKDKRGAWRWRAVARNGRVVADGSEAYSSKAKCLKGLRALRKIMLVAEEAFDA